MSPPLLRLLTERADKICAFATSSPAGAPAAALAFYLPLADGRLVFTTHTTSRKWANLAANPRAGLVVGWSFGEPHLQVDGDATLVPPGHPDFEPLAAAYYALHPAAAAARDATTAVIVLRPTWARVTVFAPDGPPRVEEGPIGG